MTTLKENLLTGSPYYGMDELVSRAELAQKGVAVEQAAAAAHRALYEGYQEKNPRVARFDDPDSSQTNQYISFKDAGGNICYDPWDAQNPATDIGIRGANPDFEGILNPTTVIHADAGALDDYRRRGAPKELVEALDAVRLFNGFIIRNVAIPYLQQVAEAFGKESDEYVGKFYPKHQRARTLTRAILYHLDAPDGMRPVSKIDGQPLLIKEHSDKSSFTIDALQSSAGLQYFVDGLWRDAGTEIACFRGTADDELTADDQASLTPSTVHRAVMRQNSLDNTSVSLRASGIARIALPTFVSLTTSDARVVQANSAETHPTN